MRKKNHSPGRSTWTRTEAGRPEAGRPEAGRTEAGRTEAGRTEAGRWSWQGKMTTPSKTGSEGHQ